MTEAATRQANLHPTVAIDSKRARWKVLDLCSGLGGISHAARELGCSIVAGVDISATALESFQHNFPGAKIIKGNIASARIIDTCRDLLRKEDAGTKTLVVSGPPCQGFSVAGPRAKRDPRNRLLTVVARTIIALDPDAALIENVAALLTKRHRRHLARFKSLLRKAGFHVVALELDAAEFGVPQHRQRMVCIASKREIAEPQLSKALKDLRVPAPTVREALAGLARPPVYKGPQACTKAAVENHVAMRHSKKVMEKISAILPGTGPMSYRRLDPDKPSRTLISGNRAPPAHYSQARSITVREAARLQAFPDSFKVIGAFSKQMLHVTNAVPPPLAKAALSALFTILEGADGR